MPHSGRAVSFWLDDGDLLVEREAVAHAGGTVLVGVDGLFHGDFVEASNSSGDFSKETILVERLDGGGDFFERLDCHSGTA